jgi:hypothetical protein
MPASFRTVISERLGRPVRVYQCQNCAKLIWEEYWNRSAKSAEVERRDLDFVELTARNWGRLPYIVLECL